MKAGAEGRLADEATVVGLVTGVGFKDRASVERMVANRPCPLLDLTELAAHFAGLGD